MAIGLPLGPSGKKNINDNSYGTHHFSGLRLFFFFNDPCQRRENRLYDESHESEQNMRDAWDRTSASTRSQVPDNVCPTVNFNVFFGLDVRPFQRGRRKDACLFFFCKVCPDCCQQHRPAIESGVTSVPQCVACSIGWGGYE